MEDNESISIKGAEEAVVSTQSTGVLIIFSELVMDVRHEHLKKRSSHVQLFLLSIFWLGYQFFLTSTSILVVPNEIERITDADFKATALGIVISLGSLINAIFNPVFGSLSDQYNGAIRIYFGKRIPFVVFGVLGISGSLLFLAGLAYFQRLPILAVTWIIVMFFAAFVQAPYSAIIPDWILREQYTAASGWMGLMTILGNAIGGSLGFFIDSGGVIATLLIVTCTLLLCMTITLVASYRMGVAGLPYKKPRDTFLLLRVWESLKKPFTCLDFFWLFWSRVSIGMGYWTIQQFIVFYVSDVVETPYTVNFFRYTYSVPDDKSAAAIYMLSMLSSAVVCALLGSYLSPRIGSKKMVYASCVFQSLAIVLVALPIFHTLEAILVVSLLFGMGFDRD
eukprot:TRINITY_DN1353_c0_g1_i15.p1 TRINITY_DN1353_c0_g1~~TRINITY_DN1353_c0_g1_i15.p1  ORF type:complete len:424 (-),score=64.27 TRINITY_DN1353_c0_g1_i15:1077-2258(-)